MDLRIGNQQLRGRVTEAREAAAMITDGMTIAVSGFADSGYPKMIPGELVRRREAGEEFKINLISGANVGPEIDGDMGRVDLIKQRIPHQNNQALAKLINAGKVSYIEIPLHKMPRIIQSGWQGKIDVAVIEAIGITKEGYIIPSTSVSMSPVFIKEAQTVIVELNHAQPAELEGIHDIYLPSLPPNKKPIPLVRTNQRIGEPFIRVDPDKIKYIVESDFPDQATVFSEDDSNTKWITANLFNFLELEMKARGFAKLPPLQSGIGNMANGIVRAFQDTNFIDLEFYCGILQDANFELITQGKVRAASGTALTSSPKVLQAIRQNREIMKRIVALRPLDVSNNPEIVDRLGLICLNSAIEIDIYGNANTSHLIGSKVVTGIGGGGAFTQNAYLSMMLLPSVTKGGNISTIVPMVSHFDINEHDIDVVITENGVADLRWKDPLERANCLIDNCASPLYREQLRSYLRKAVGKTGGHQPQYLQEAFSWHQRLLETGTMQKV